jgi:hypothetical protein
MQAQYETFHYLSGYKFQMLIEGLLQQHYYIVLDIGKVKGK